MTPLAERARAALDRIRSRLGAQDDDDLATIREALAAKAAPDQEREEVAYRLEDAAMHCDKDRMKMTAATLRQAARLLRTPAPCPHVYTGKGGTSHCTLNPTVVPDLFNGGVGPDDV